MVLCTFVFEITLVEFWKYILASKKTLANSKDLCELTGAPSLGFVSTEIILQLKESQTFKKWFIYFTVDKLFTFYNTNYKTLHILHVQKYVYFGR